MQPGSGGVPTRQRGFPKCPAVLGWVAAGQNGFLQFAEEPENYGGVEAHGGTINFDNSEIAHTKYECVNAHSSGNFTARNSVFRDSSLGFGYYGSGRVKAYNCVFSDLSVAIRQSGKTLVNCVFYRCLAFTDQGGDGSSFSNCVFFKLGG